MLSDDAPEPLYVGRYHTFDGERCVYCGINIYDSFNDPCVDHEPIAYTTESV